MASVRKFDQRNARKFPATIWGIVAFAAFAVPAILGVPVISFEDGVAFHPEVLFWLAPFILLVIMVFAAVQRFTPLLTLPRHHDQKDEDSKDRAAS
jgi:fatty acid desaturase